MSNPSRGRGGRVLLVSSLALLALFTALLYLQWRRSREQRFVPDAELIDELCRSEIVEEGEAPGDSGWPQWRGPRRDGVAAAGRILATWPATGPRRLWRKTIGEGYASFAVVSGRFYTHVRDNDREVVLCCQADSGEELWRFEYDCTYTNGYGNGPRGTPALVDGKLFTIGATGLMHCLNSATGEVIWKRDLLAEFQAPTPQWGVSFSPLVEGGLLYTMPGGRSGGALASFTKDTGALAWKSQDDAAGYGSPVAAVIGGVRQVLFFTGTDLVGVMAESGHLLWRYSWPTYAAVNAATPIVFRARCDGRESHYVFISSGYGKGCTLLKIEPTGTGSFRARPVYEGTQMRNHFASSVLWRGHVYGFDETALACLDVKNGDVLWKKDGFQKGSLLVADGKLIVLGERGDLALAEASPDGWREHGRFRAFRSHRCWVMPVVAEGRLYIRDLDDVACYDVRAR